MSICEGDDFSQVRNEVKTCILKMRSFGVAKVDRLTSRAISAAKLNVLMKSSTEQMSICEGDDFSQVRNEVKTCILKMRSFAVAKVDRLTSRAISAAMLNVLILFSMFSIITVELKVGTER